ncbi:MAG: hypothetical protein ABL957_01550 [Parvularculaceae bacterium]
MVIETAIPDLENFLRRMTNDQEREYRCRLEELFGRCSVVSKPLDVTMFAI